MKTLEIASTGYFLHVYGIILLYEEGATFRVN